MTQFRPLLAATCDDSNINQLSYPLLASPKLDGIRALVYKGQLVSRSLKPIRNNRLQNACDWSKFEGLDGELILGYPARADVFRDTTSAVMSAGGPIKDLFFWVFDTHTLNTGFTNRIQLIHNIDFPSFIKPVYHELIENNRELLVYEEQCLDMGYEGAMLRNPLGEYKHGRSTFREQILMKLKRGQLQNGDAIIIGFNERMHNQNEAEVDNLGLCKRSSSKENMVGRGDLGSLTVRDIESGVTFSIGTGDGLDDRLRAEIWNFQASYLGKIVRYQWFKYGNYDKPRFPKFVEIRDREDM